MLLISKVSCDRMNYRSKKSARNYQAQISLLLLPPVSFYHHSPWTKVHSWLAMSVNGRSFTASFSLCWAPRWDGVAWWGHLLLKTGLGSKVHFHWPLKGNDILTTSATAELGWMWLVGDWHHMPATLFHTRFISSPSQRIWKQPSSIPI